MKALASVGEGSETIVRGLELATEEDANSVVFFCRCVAGGGYFCD